MLYAGFIYSKSYYGYYHLDTLAIGFDSFELAVRSLRLATFPVLIALVLLVLLPHLPHWLKLLHVPVQALDQTRRWARAAAQGYPLLVACGLLLLLWWSSIQPVRWLPPLLIASGLLLGLTRAAHAGEERGQPRWERAVSAVVAALFLLWVVALAAGQLGRRDAQADADRLVRRVAVVVYSKERLSISGPPELKSEDLGAGAPYRYRYSGLRLLVERDHRYYLLPLGWQKDQDPTFVIEDDETLRIELRPGTRPRP
ncbi:hypothetical protein AB0M28_20715 [Streptomyces sp. NPDC051940]|uniref:hypothetical protein n=1 Tax=Streptomyces sp. NPDC051940 TaxID=3155675 RepID=UPI003436370A